MFSTLRLLVRLILLQHRLAHSFKNRPAFRTRDWPRADVAPQRTIEVNRLFVPKANTVQHGSASEDTLIRQTFQQVGYAL
jgi:hypothetical protein